MHPVQIRRHDAFTLAAVDHIGAYMKIGAAFATLDDWLGSHELRTQATRMLALYLDDPSQVAEDALRAKAGVEIPQPETFPFDATVSRMEVAGGEFAVLTHVGPYEKLDDAYHWFYQDWLVHSGRRAADAPVHEVYLNTPRDAAPEQLTTEIWLPLTIPG